MADVYLIVMDSDEDEILYWSHEHGAVRLDQATVYSEADYQTMNLPIGGSWVKFAEGPS